MICIGYATLGPYARQESAISTEAKIAQQAATAVVQSAEESRVLFGSKANAITQLMNLAYECCEQGWDGYDASAINPEAVYLAETLVRQLPAGIPLPEFTPEPDGSVSMDWIASPTRLFTLSVGTSHRLAYAWVDGADKGHAVARFDGETVPARISEGIRGIINHGGTAFRPL